MRSQNQLQKSFGLEKKKIKLTIERMRRNYLNLKNNDYINRTWVFKWIIDEFGLSRLETLLMILKSITFM